MDKAKQMLPSLISIVGVDGSGKTTLANWLASEAKAQGHNPVLVWSRFRNYLSKPLLAITRLTGHNYYKTIDNINFGFHDFEKLIVYRELFAILQAIDVNIAAYMRISRQRTISNPVICERGPWDTLVDVTTDTGLDWLPTSQLGAVYSLTMRHDAQVLWIKRSRDNILETRPELVNDHKLMPRMEVYEKLAMRHNWHVIENNGSLEAAKEQIRNILNMVDTSTLTP